MAWDNFRYRNVRFIAGENKVQMGLREIQTILKHRSYKASVRIIHSCVFKYISTPIFQRYLVFSHADIDIRSANQPTEM